MGWDPPQRSICRKSSGQPCGLLILPTSLVEGSWPSPENASSGRRGSRRCKRHRTQPDSQIQFLVLVSASTLEIRQCFPQGTPNPPRSWWGEDRNRRSPMLLRQQGSTPFPGGSTLFHSSQFLHQVWSSRFRTDRRECHSWEGILEDRTASYSYRAPTLQVLSPSPREVGNPYIRRALQISQFVQNRRVCSARRFYPSSIYYLGQFPIKNCLGTRNYPSSNSISRPLSA